MLDCFLALVLRRLFIMFGWLLFEEVFRVRDVFRGIELDFMTGTFRAYIEFFVVIPLLAPYSTLRPKLTECRLVYAFICASCAINPLPLVF